MALYLLYNYSGEISDDQGAIYAGVSSSGYDIKDLIAGPRSTHHRLNTSVSEVGMAYYHTASVTLDYLVVARADWLLTQNGTRVRVAQAALGSSSFSNSSSFDFNPLATSDLIGVRSQDLVIDISVMGSLGGMGLSATPVSGGQSMQISKLYGCLALDMGVNPAIGHVSEMLPVNTYATPISGTIPYEIEQRFSLIWQARSMLQMTNFKTAPQLFNWPIFLYDETGDIWDWKLEHVIIESFQEDIQEKGTHSLTVNFARLRQYD